MPRDLFALVPSCALAASDEKRTYALGELCHAYDRGVRQVRGFQEVWDSVEPFVDVRRFREVQSKLKIQMRDAVWWKDACLLYFQTFSGMPIPAGIERPVHELEDMKRFRLEISNYECPESGFNK